VPAARMPITGPTGAWPSVAADSIFLALADGAGDALSDVKLPEITLPSLELPDLAWWD